MLDLVAAHLGVVVGEGAHLPGEFRLHPRLQHCAVAIQWGNRYRTPKRNFQDVLPANNLVTSISLG